MAVPPKDRWVKCISTQGSIRGVALRATDIVRSTVELHGLDGLQAQGMGEALMGALLISSYCKEGERVNLNIQGTGHIRQALVDAYPDGKVRGYVIGRESETAFLGKQNDLGIWGEGYLSVLRTKDGAEGGRRPYIGTVPLVTGHLAKDLTFYWAQSEQVPSAVGLAVNFKDGKVSSAGGFLIQALPGARMDEIKVIEQHIQEIASFAESVAKEADPLMLLSQVFQDTAFVLLEEKPLQFTCNCSWTRVERALALVGVAELRDMLAKDSQASIRCDFCAKDYVIDAAGLERLISLGAGKTPAKSDND